MEPALFSGFALDSMTVNISNNNIDCCSNTEGSGLNSNSPSPKNNVGVIVGCVIGILLLITIALIVGFLIYRSKKNDLLEGKTAKEFVLNSNADLMESSVEYTAYDDEAVLACDKKTETDEANLNIYEEEDCNYHTPCIIITPRYLLTCDLIVVRILTVVPCNSVVQFKN
eukprot:Pgem_evm4s252